MKKLVLAIFLITMPGCCKMFGKNCRTSANACETVAEKRCHGNLIQVCNSKKYWDSFMDCSKVSGKCGLSVRDGKTLTCNIDKAVK